MKGLSLCCLFAAALFCVYGMRLSGTGEESPHYDVNGRQTSIFQPCVEKCYYFYDENVTKCEPDNVDGADPFRRLIVKNQDALNSWALTYVNQWIKSLGKARVPIGKDKSEQASYVRIPGVNLKGYLMLQLPGIWGGKEGLYFSLDSESTCRLDECLYQSELTVFNNAYEAGFESIEKDAPNERSEDEEELLFGEIRSRQYWPQYRSALVDRFDCLREYFTE